jgi:hypothetical protein
LTKIDSIIRVAGVVGFRGIAVFAKASLPVDGADTLSDTSFSREIGGPLGVGHGRN